MWIALTPKQAWAIEEKGLEIEGNLKMTKNDIFRYTDIILVTFSQ